MSSVMEIAMKEMGHLIELAKANLKVLPGPIVNVAGYGAVGDGVTNDTIVVQSAIDYAILNGMKAVFFPRGTNGQYYATSLTNADQVVLFGDNASFVGGYTGTILQLGEGGVTQADLDALEATVTTLDSELTELESETVTGVFNAVTGYNADPTGATDSTTEIQAAISAASVAGGGIVYLPPGDYLVSAITGASEVVIEGAGRGLTTIILTDENSVGINFSVGHSGSVLLGANVAIGDKTVTVAAGEGSKYVAGDIIYLEETATYNGKFTTFVQSVLGDVVTLQEACPYAYSTANSARAFYYTAPNSILKDCGIRGLTVKTIGNTYPTNREDLVVFTRVLRGVVEECHFENAKVCGIIFNGCRDSDIASNTFYQIGNSGDGINVQASTNCYVSKNVMRQVAFGIVAAFSSRIIVDENILSGRINVVNGRGIKFEAGCTECKATKNSLSDFGLNTIYVTDSWNNIIGGNNIFNCGFDSANHGIAVSGNIPTQTYGNMIIDNIINKIGGYGIVVTYSDGTINTYTTISGNKITNTTNGINPATSGNIIQDNDIRNYGASAGNRGIVTSATTTGNSICNNRIRNAGVGKAIDTIASGGSNFIKGNDIGAEPISTLATDKFDLIKRGKVALSLSSEQLKSQVVTFTTPFPSLSPIIVVTTDSASFIAAVSSITQSQFTLTVQHRAGTVTTATINAHWHAALEMD